MKDFDTTARAGALRVWRALNRAAPKTTHAARAATVLTTLLATLVTAGIAAPLHAGAPKAKHAEAVQVRGVSVPLPQGFRAKIVQDKLVVLHGPPLLGTVSVLDDAPQSTWAQRLGDTIALEKISLTAVSPLSKSGTGPTAVWARFYKVPEGQPALIALTGVGTDRTVHVMLFGGAEGAYSALQVKAQPILQGLKRVADAPAPSAVPMPSLSRGEQAPAPSFDRGAPAPAHAAPSDAAPTDPTALAGLPAPDPDRFITTVKQSVKPSPDDSAAISELKQKYATFMGAEGARRGPVRLGQTKVPLPRGAKYAGSPEKAVVLAPAWGVCVVQLSPLPLSSTADLAPVLEATAARLPGAEPFAGLPHTVVSQNTDGTVLMQLVPPRRLPKTMRRWALMHPGVLVLAACPERVPAPLYAWMKSLGSKTTFAKGNVAAGQPFDLGGWDHGASLRGTLPAGFTIESNDGGKLTAASGEQAKLMLMLGEDKSSWEDAVQTLAAQFPQFQRVRPAITGKHIVVMQAENAELIFVGRRTSGVWSIAIYAGPKQGAPLQGALVAMMRGAKTKAMVLPPRVKAYRKGLNGVAFSFTDSFESGMFLNETHVTLCPGGQAWWNEETNITYGSGMNTVERLSGRWSVVPGNRGPVLELYSSNKNVSYILSGSIDALALDGSRARRIRRARCD